MKILILGSKSVVGHVVKLYFKEQNHLVFDEYDFLGLNIENLHIESLYSYDFLQTLIRNEHFDAVINCTAIVNEYAENDKAGAAYINTYLPHLLESITSNTSTIVVHRSTDCIFSGNRGNYTLNDIPDANSFYARTKAVGELINKKDITIRVSLIGPSLTEEDNSLLNWFLRQNQVKGFSNSIWTGLTTLEYAKVIEKLLCLRAFGLFQAAPSSSISKYDLLKLFEKYFPNSRKIERIENQKVDKSLVAYWGKLEMVIADYETQIKEMKEWIFDHKDIYPSYYYKKP